MPFALIRSCSDSSATVTPTSSQCWGRPLPSRRGRGVSVQSAFGSYLAQVAEVEVTANGSLKVHRIVCAVDCGMVVNPDTIEAQVQGGTFFGLTAALYGVITLKNGRVEQGNFDTYRPLRIDEAPVGRNTSGQRRQAQSSERSRAEAD